jgi:hypothetical protein
MPQLGQMLVKEKIISAKQLDEAIQAQVIFGGRLGTNLVELGYLDEQTLTKSLARKHGVPTVDWTQLNRIKPAVLKLFSKNLAKRCEAFPLKVEGKDIYVVMSDPANFEAIQEINFATGKKVKPLVLPEIRVYDLLTRFYNIGRELRYINLAMMYQVKEEKKPEQVKEGPPPGMDEQEWREREEVRKKIDFNVSQDLLGEDDFMKITNQQFAQQLGMPAPEPPSPAAPAPAPEPGPPPAPVPAPRAEPPRPVPAPTKAPAPPAAKAPEPPRVKVPETKTPPARTPGVQPHKEVAQLLYSMLMKRGVSKYIAKEKLQEFMKLFVKNQLKNDILSMNYLANWLIIEADAPVEWLEKVLTEFKGMALDLGITALLPGEAVPVKAARAAAPRAEEKPKPKPAAPEPAPAAEVIEEAELMEAEEVEELPAQALTPVREPAPAEPAAEAMPAPPGPPPRQTDPAAPKPSAAKPAEQFLDELEAMEKGEGGAQVLELKMEDLASVEEAEAYVPEEEPEEEPEEAEYVQLTLNEAREKLLSEVIDRGDISRIVLGFAMGYFKRSLLFTVRGQTLFGWDGTGPGVKTDLVESIMLPLTEPSVFQLVNLTKSFFLGPVQPGAVNDRFLKLLGGQKPNNVFIIPVVVNEKVVYILYGDNGGGEFVPLNAPELQILAYQIPHALESLIKRKKAGKSAA